MASNAFEGILENVQNQLVQELICQSGVKNLPIHRLTFVGFCVVLQIHIIWACPGHQSINPKIYAQSLRTPASCKVNLQLCNTSHHICMAPLCYWIVKYVIIMTINLIVMIVVNS